MTAERFLAALAVSLGLHLILISVRLADKEAEVRRFYIRKLPDLFSTQRFRASDPDVPDPLMDKLASPSPSPPRTRLDPSPSIFPIPRIYLPESLREPVGSGARPEEFVAGDLDLPTLEELAMAAALRKAKAERYERYAYLPLALIDSTTASQRMARQIVMRAVEAMGGVAALARITRLQKRVWVEAHEHVVGPTTIGKKMFPLPGGNLARPPGSIRSTSGRSPFTYRSTWIAPTRSTRCTIPPELWGNTAG